MNQIEQEKKNLQKKEKDELIEELVSTRRSKAGIASDREHWRAKAVEAAKLADLNGSTDVAALKERLREAQHARNYFKNQNQKMKKQLRMYTSRLLEPKKLTLVCFFIALAAFLLGGWLL